MATYLSGTLGGHHAQRLQHHRLGLVRVSSTLQDLLRSDHHEMRVLPALVVENNSTKAMLGSGKSSEKGTYGLDKNVNDHAHFFVRRNGLLRNQSRQDRL